ncbi:MAG: hypothetical protein V3W20_10860 [Candidatus Neomarinimicrobiota bacterium]
MVVYVLESSKKINVSMLTFTATGSHEPTEVVMTTRVTEGGGELPHYSSQFL